MSLPVIHQIPDMQQQSRRWRQAGLRLGLVPTMGFLHDGHLSLIEEARRHADRVVVSIFVNPLQFGPNEDLETYPRDLDRDRRLCAEAGADVGFQPTPEVMYPPCHSTWVVEDQLSRPLCGARRPGHFRGVATVVAKLFNIVLPDVAVFGRKDAQQALLIRRVTADLNFPIEIVIAPTIREPDGLAMSSRNTYLTASERQEALAIHRGLTAAADAFRGGERDVETLLGLVRDEVDGTSGQIDYLECRETQELREMATIDREVLVAIAVRYGKARLIDNLFLRP